MKFKNGQWPVRIFSFAVGVRCARVCSAAGAGSQIVPTNPLAAERQAVAAGEWVLTSTSNAHRRQILSRRTSG